MLPEFKKLATAVGDTLQKKSLKLVTAESCTGGWVAQVLTAIPGASAYFERGFVAYSNESKQKLLGVSAEALAKFGATSEQVVKEMAEGALKNSRADVSIAISGLAGPGDGGEKQPIGTVWFGLSQKGKVTTVSCQHFEGDREKIRTQAVRFVLAGLLEYLKD